MKTLLTLLGERQEELIQRINRAADLEHASQVLQTELLSLERISVPDLSPSAARTQGFVLEALRAFSPVVVAASEVEFQRSSDAADAAPDQELTLKAVQLGLAFVLFLSLISVATLPALLSLVLAVLLARELSMAISSIEARIPRPFRCLIKILPWKVPSSTPSPQDRRVVVRCNGLVALRHLGNALDVVDRAVQGVENDRSQEPGQRAKLEDFPELLDFFQELMGPALSRDAETTMRSTKQLRQILRNYGLRMESYDPSAADVELSWFATEPSLDPGATGYQTVTPALVTTDGSRVVRQGRVSAPVPG